MNSAWPPRSASILIAALVFVTGCAQQDPSGVRVSGQIEATEVRLATKVAGTIASRPVEEGDRVERGALVAVIDTVDLDLDRRAAVAERDRAKAQLEVLLAGSRVEDVRAARAVAAARDADRSFAESEFDRIEALYRRDVVAENARDQARTRRDMARAITQRSQDHDCRHAQRHRQNDEK